MNNGGIGTNGIYILKYDTTIYESISKPEEGIGSFSIFNNTQKTY